MKHFVFKTLSFDPLDSFTLRIWKKVFYQNSHKMYMFRKILPLEYAFYDTISGLRF